MSNLVQVQFRNRFGEGYGGAAYTYAADVPLAVGDIVTVPTKFGESEARVCRVDVPEAEVEHFRDKLKHITQPASESESLFAEFFSSEVFDNARMSVQPRH